MVHYALVLVLTLTLYFLSQISTERNRHFKNAFNVLWFVPWLYNKKQGSLIRHQLLVTT